MKGEKIRKMKMLAFFAALVITATYTLVIVQAEGPHIETPRCAIFNEIKAGEGTWIELVNPGTKNVMLKDWKIQTLENGEWKDIHVFGPDLVKKWGSGDEYFVVDLDTALPTGDVDLRLEDDYGNEIDTTSYSSLDDDHSWARYRNQSDGTPIDTDLPDDWYVSSNMTKGYGNDLTK